MRFRVYTCRTVLATTLPFSLERSGLGERRFADKRITAKRRLLIEHLTPRQVFANLAGVVFEDQNQSWRQDADEPGSESRVLYADANNNGSIDEGETVVLTDADGRFEFDGLSGDEAIIRLFDGSADPPLPFFPVQTSVSEPIAINGGTAFVGLRNGEIITLAGTAAVRSDLETGTTLATNIPSAIRTAELLPDGRLLVLASDGQGNHAFTITDAGTLAPIKLQNPGPVAGWADVAIDKSGNGLLVESSSNATLLRAVSIGETIVVGNTTTTVGSGTRVISGGDVTSLISTPTDDGLQLRLWSNATGTEIGSGGVNIAGGTEVLSYDDASGLVLLRTAADAVTLLDADSGFASLQTITGVAGPVVVDAARELLFAISPTDAALKIIDLNSAALLGQFALDTDNVQTARQLAFDSTTGNLLLLTATGLTTVSLPRSASQRVELSASAPPYELSFAIGSPAVNVAPKFDSLPSLVVAEDTALVIASPKVLETASDADDDSFIVLLKSQATNGIVALTPTGGLGYIPNKDFFGTDTFSVILHDGKNASDPIPLSVNVTPVDDPILISVTPNVVPENALVDAIAGFVRVVNADGGNIVWTTNDPRFNVVKDMLVVAPGSRFDYETEPKITVQLRATQPTSGAVATKSIELIVGDISEPIKEIRPDTAVVDENRAGELIAELSVLDDGSGEDYLFTVDDSRFQVTFRDLRLKPGVSLNFESTPTVTVNITATSASGATKTEPLVITVRDVPEQAKDLSLSRTQVKELVRGATVGDLLVDGVALSSGYTARVDDSRFTIEGSTLKLRGSEFVRRSSQQEIQLVVTIQDSASVFLPVVGTFVVEVLANQNPFHNDQNPYDVNGDQQVNPLDALLVVNSISRNRGPGPISDFPSPDRFYDVNGDGSITALDALLIINYLNRRIRSEGEPESSQPIAAPEIIPSGKIATTPPKQQAEPESNDFEAQPAPSSFSSLNEDESEARLELVKLRDDAIELLAGDELSAASEVNAAIDDFF